MNPEPASSPVEIVIRVDSGTDLGSGHVMRTVTLARELRAKGAKVEFICRELDGNFIARIEANGFAVTRLGRVPATEWTELNEQNDAAETIAALGARRPDWLIVDHYSLGRSWEGALRSFVRKILVVEDLAGRFHDCDMLLDQNFLGDDANHRHSAFVPRQSQCLAGPRYALLQPEYAQLRRILPRRPARAHRVLIFFGGSDPSGETAKALAALSRPEFLHLGVDVVLSQNSNLRDDIVAQAESRPDTEVHEYLPGLAALMIRADIALGGGGATAWERICLGLPAVVTTLASNQIPGTRALESTQWVRWTGVAGEVSIDDYVVAVREVLAADIPEVPLVDGLGARRVAEAMLPNTPESLRLRRAVREDAAIFFDWRNDPFVRAMSINSDEIAWSTHRTWFQRRLDDPDTSIYVAECAGLPIGQVRLDFHGDHAMLSYSLDPVVRGRGWSRWMIAEAVSKDVRAKSCEVRAVVKKENHASRKIFSGLGWLESLNSEGNLLYVWCESRMGLKH